MNKIFAVIISLALIATPALAFGDWAVTKTYLDATGETEYISDSGIANYQGYTLGEVTENVFNCGDITLLENLVFKKGDVRKMLESKNVDTTGFTSIIKEVDWTSPGAPGFLNEANIFVGAYTPYSWDEKQVENEGAGMFVYNVKTSSPLHYVESFGLNKETDCTPRLPRLPELPVCECPTCPCD